MKLWQILMEQNILEPFTLLCALVLQRWPHGQVQPALPFLLTSGCFGEADNDHRERTVC